MVSYPRNCMLTNCVSTPYAEPVLIKFSHNTVGFILSENQELPMKNRWLLTSFLLIVAITLAPVPTGAAESADHTIQQVSDCSRSEAKDSEITSVSIQATDETVTATDPAEISGQITADQSNPCPITAHTVIHIPSGIQVASTTNLDSGGPGEVSGTTTLAPGETATISISTYGKSVGEKMFIADFSYYPTGYPEMEKSNSGYIIEVSVDESGQREEDITLLEQILGIFGLS